MNLTANENSELRFPAIRVEQGANRVLYAFSFDGKDVLEFADISRLKRSSGGEILGYQRPEVQAHVAEIRAYLESENPMIPNAIVIAFDSTVRFEPLDGLLREGASLGELVIPSVDGSGGSRPGWVVDGQQRLAAVREAQIESFPVMATAFIASSEDDQREQFILVNATKPLPKGLIYELLPSTETRLPSRLLKKRIPSKILSLLNNQPDSPFHGRIRTPTSPDGYIRDNSVLRMLENSLTDGVLYRVRLTASADEGLKSSVELIRNFWGAVREVFSDAFELPPRKSRLTHGVGIVGLGFLMDAICERVQNGATPSSSVFAEEVLRIAPQCRWTEGIWEGGPLHGRKWNEVQNTAADTRLVANQLLSAYRFSLRDRLGSAERLRIETQGG